jgi:RimJ/RimL family protein N-acetyltransferase
MKRENLLCGEKVKLNAVRDEDMETVTEWYQDAGFLRLYDSQPAAPVTGKQLAERLQKQQEDPNTFLFAIRLVDTNRIIGLLELDGVAWTHGTSFVSIGLGEEADRGQGYGREAMRLALRFAFYELNLHRICLTVFDYNTAAVALYEGLGFKREGTYREHLLRDGQRHDMYLYGLLRREWEEGLKS